MFDQIMKTSGEVYSGATELKLTVKHSIISNELYTFTEQNYFETSTRAGFYNNVFGF